MTRKHPADKLPDPIEGGPNREVFLLGYANDMANIITRCLPFKLKLRLRGWMKSINYRVAVSTGRQDPLVPPPALLPIVPGDYIEIGEEFLRYFIDLADLKPEETVLEVGSGTGRMARALSRYLTSGRYDGLDIMAPAIRWCRRTYKHRYPNFQFYLCDIYNGKYNSRGKCRGSEYRFPFGTSSFDFIFLTSVFTHMLVQDLENYFSEIARVLRPGGRCLITYFMLTSDSLQVNEKNVNGPSFRYTRPGCRVYNDDDPEEAVAYGENEIRELYQKHGLRIEEPIRYGSWAGRKDWLSYQDIIIARKDDSG